MTTEEFSNEFDVLLNSYAILDKFNEGENFITVELDEYEKSVFLTKAQEELLINFYTGKNPFKESIESTEEIREYLDSLIKTTKFEFGNKDKEEDKEEDKNKYLIPSFKEYKVNKPDDLWYILYERAVLKSENKCVDNTSAIVIPVTHDTLDFILENPFKRPNERKLLRLNFRDDDNTKIELITKYDLSTYVIRYLARPTPIILLDLPENLTINGVYTKTSCTLNPMLHRTILENAVQMALTTKRPKVNLNNKQNV